MTLGGKLGVAWISGVEFIVLLATCIVKAVYLVWVKPVQNIYLFPPIIGIETVLFALEILQIAFQEKLKENNNINNFLRKVIETIVIVTNFQTILHIRNSDEIFCNNLKGIIK